jgi:hypothetical protein
MTCEVIDRLTRAARGWRHAADARRPIPKELVMSNTIQPSVLLRRVLWADAIVSAAVGALMALGAPALHGLLGLPVALLLIAGVALLPYAAYLVWLATRPCVPRAAVWLPIALNLVWAVDCGLVLFGAGAHPTALGEAFIALQIVTVLAFAELEFIGLRACAIVPA